MVQFSFRPPNADYLGFPATTEAILETACKAEELGFDAVLVNDHIIVDGTPNMLESWGNTYDPLMVLSYLAAQNLEPWECPTRSAALAPPSICVCGKPAGCLGRPPSTGGFSPSTPCMSTQSLCSSPIRPSGSVAPATHRCGGRRPRPGVATHADAPGRSDH